MKKNFVLIKAITWQVSGLLVTLLITRAYTGAWSAASEMTLLLMGISFFSYLLHEYAWGRVLARQPTPVQRDGDETAPGMRGAVNQ